MVDILGWLKERWQKEAVHYQFINIPSNHVGLTGGRTADTTVLKAGYHYYQLWLTDMFIKYDKEWFSEYQPSVHSVVALQFGEKEVVLTNVAGQSRLGDVAAGVQRNINLNYKLTTVLPFNGGTVEIEAGLVAIKGKDEIKTLLSVMGDFSDLLMVPQLSAALAVAGPIAKGLTQIVGTSGNIPQLRLHQTLKGESNSGDNILRAGYFAAIAAETGKLDPKKFWVKSDLLHYGDSLDTSQRLSGYHYMLFRLDCHDQRDDLESLTKIWEPFDKSLGSLAKGDEKEADAYVKTAIVAALDAQELTSEVDRLRVPTQLKAKYKARKEALQSLGAVDADKEFVLSAESVMENALKPQEIEEAGKTSLIAKLFDEPF